MGIEQIQVQNTRIFPEHKIQWPGSVKVKYADFGRAIMQQVNTVIEKYCSVFIYGGPYREETVFEEKAYVKKGIDGYPYPLKWIIAPGQYRQKLKNFIRKILHPVMIMTGCTINHKTDRVVIDRMVGLLFLKKTGERNKNYGSSISILQ